MTSNKYKLYYLAVLLFFDYYMLLETYMGRTFGKIATNSVVINEYGDDLKLSEAALRTVIRFVPFESLSCISDMGWHDKWSSTYVVSKEEREKIRKALAQFEFVEGKWQKKSSFKVSKAQD